MYIAVRVIFALSIYLTEKGVKIHQQNDFTVEPDLSNSKLEKSKGRVFVDFIFLSYMMRSFGSRKVLKEFCNFRTEGTFFLDHNEYKRDGEHES